MRTRREIETRLAQENDAFAIEVLRWVLAGGCAMCDHKKRKDLEVQLQNEETDPVYLETRYNWPEGTVMYHMDNHVEFDPDEAKHIEDARSKSIDTLDSAEDIVLRIRSYLDELEEQKEAQGGITSEFVADASRLISQANSALKLVGQLNKEIGVDSQLLLAQAQMNDISRILVDTLRDQPHLLDLVERRMLSMNTVIDTEYEVVE